MQMTRFDQHAIEQIERCGGLAVSVYHDAKGLQFMRRPGSVSLAGKLMPPMNYKERAFYSSWEQRGYLHPDVNAKLCLADPTFKERYLMVKPVRLIEKTVFPMRNIPHELRQEGLLKD